jgi:glycosyltransferase involved in cell wall biosynthesis
MEIIPWVSFCMSTYKRPEILSNQLALLAKQTFKAFEVIISDNDPEGSAKEVVEYLGDKRFVYYKNDTNLGMIPSFNKSIERASAPWIIMVTDDDPVDISMLDFFYPLVMQYPGYSLYGGFERRNRTGGEIEKIAGNKIVEEMLDPELTTNLLWSSVILNKQDVISIGSIPIYGSPHLADHALLAKTASVNGGMIVNRMFSSLTSHDANFSKFNFNYYVDGCKGFYNTMTRDNNSLERVVRKHLAHWFIATFFSAKKYYTVVKKDHEMLRNISDCANQILSFPFMKSIRLRYRLKNIIFVIKRSVGLLKVPLKES